MGTKIGDSLLYEEKRATIWFLWLFYIIFFGYDITYHYILPVTPWRIEALPSNFGLNIFLYVAMLSLIPIAYYLMKKQRPEKIKYMVFFTYTILYIFHDLFVYWDNASTYASGNIAEIMIVLFSPMFISKRFFYTVFLGTVLKFAIIGVVLQDTIVLFPMLMVLVIALIASLLLYRFLSYVDAVKDSYSKQLEGIVKGVIATLELKDPYTRGHSERVADYAIMLAKTTGKFTENQLQTIYYTCLLHDIGKIHIPDSILTKPGKLTEEEYELVKQHPTVGAKAVQDVEGISEYMDIILYHHERWDGKGYPNGLKGEDTPLLARITAIADAFDAMTTTRSYRAALPHEEAYKRIMDGKGTQFDPQLVEAFKDVYPSWKAYHQKYRS
ncbi:HD-GYP domain-containing protein [Oceanobacillus halophilus]|uniref:HD-GYP domain-containing protein n=1 Tax=Oceanobacillus halophilus TaxID=930130 RepID=A0A494ZQJ0_9BACI|nr:HD-GYP domain-containing protein [Oceanobacillus halophilus]RKQ27558.1 HD-GYP domain-containing protein [Oceanobacillus halophilus]